MTDTNQRLEQAIGDLQAAIDFARELQATRHPEDLPDDLETLQGHITDATLETTWAIEDLGNGSVAQLHGILRHEIDSSVRNPYRAG